MKRKSTLNKIIKNRAEGLAPMQRSKVNSITPKTRAKARATLKPFKTITDSRYNQALKTLNSLAPITDLVKLGYNKQKSRFTKQQKIDKIKPYLEQANIIFQQNAKAMKINMNTQAGKKAVKESFNFNFYYNNVYSKMDNLNKLTHKQLNRLISNVIDYLASPASQISHIRKTVENYNKIEGMIEDALKQVPKELLDKQGELIRKMLWELVKKSKGKGWEWYKEILQDFTNTISNMNNVTEDYFVKYIEKQLNNQTSTIKRDPNKAKVGTAAMGMAEAKMYEDMKKMYKKGK